MEPFRKTPVKPFIPVVFGTLTLPIVKKIDIEEFRICSSVFGNCQGNLGGKIFFRLIAVKLHVFAYIFSEDNIECSAWEKLILNHSFYFSISVLTALSLT